MVKPVTETLYIDVEPRLARLEEQLAVLRTLCSHIGFALDTAIISLHELGDYDDVA
jgi:hypothetical protein